jgi:hypothetical protein
VARLIWEPVRGRQGVPVDPGRGVAGELEGVAPLGQAEPQGDLTLQLDGPHLAAVLLALGLALRHLVVVELAIKDLDAPVEEVDEAPQNIVGVVLKARLGEQVGEGVHRADQCLLDGFGLRHRPRVGVLLERTVVLRQQLAEETGIRLGGVICEEGRRSVELIEHGMASGRWKPRPPRP